MSDSKCRCPECHKPFSARKCLNRHLRTLHNYDESQLHNFHLTQVPEEERFVCSDCSKIMKSKRNLAQHKQKVHRIEEVEMDNDKLKRNPPGILCSLCEERLITQRALIDHHNAVHAIHEAKHMIITETFSTQESYEDWISHWCANTGSGFKMNGSKRFVDKVIQYFRCRHVETASSKDSLKTYKIVASCTAYIKKTSSTNNGTNILVEGCFSHTHTLDNHDFPLPYESSSEVPEFDSLNVPFIQDSDIKKENPESNEEYSTHARFLQKNNFESVDAEMEQSSASSKPRQIVELKLINENLEKISKPLPTLEKQENEQSDVVQRVDRHLSRSTRSTKRSSSSSNGFITTRNDADQCRIIKYRRKC